MIGTLRFVGILNAAVWLGAAIFFTFGIAPAIFSQEMQGLLEPKNYPYFSGAIAQIFIAHYFRLQLVCSIAALLHSVVEWLYLGKAPQKLWIGLLIGLFSVNLAGGCWLQPKLKRLHTTKYASNIRPEERRAAGETFRTWHGMAQVLNLLITGSVAVYLWRVANPPDPTRFLSATKFRS